MSQLYHPRHLEYRSSWYVVYEYSTAVSNTVSSLRDGRIKQTWNDWNDDCSELNRFFYKYKNESEKEKEKNSELCAYKAGHFIIHLTQMNHRFDVYKTRIYEIIEIKGSRYHDRTMVSDLSKEIRHICTYMESEFTFDAKNFP